MPFGIQPWHLIVVVIVALVIFGPSRLPQLGRSLGSFFKDLRSGARDMSKGFKEGMQEPAQAAENTNTERQSETEKADVTVSKKPENKKGNYCISCGTSNPLNAKYCNNCGKLIKD